MDSWAHKALLGLPGVSCAEISEWRLALDIENGGQTFDLVHFLREVLKMHPLLLLYRAFQAESKAIEQRREACQW